MEQCRHLEDLSIQFCIFDSRNFADIFDIICVLRTLNFKKTSRIQKEIDSNEISSFMKSNNERRKTLDYMELFMDLNIGKDLVEQLCVLTASSFGATTLNSAIRRGMKKDSTFIRSVVRNIHGLEHLSIDDFSESESFIPPLWSGLMADKISLNNQLGVSKKLIVYVRNGCEEKLNTQLVNCYDPQIISIASTSNFAVKQMKLWYW